MNVISERNSGFGRIGLLVGLALLAPYSAREALAQNGACCLGNGTCIDTNTAGCALGSGDFLGAGTSCAKSVCTGACCLPEKQCAEGSRDDCVSGTYQGAGSTCATHCAGRLGTGFTYQGQLKENGQPVTDTIDLEASLWTAAIDGDQVGATLRFDGLGGNPPPIEVGNGLFTVDLDFGAEAFNGNTRYLEIAVRRPHDPSGQAAFTVLEPRQPITPTPYAGFARNALTATTASTATDSTLLNGQPAPFYQNASNINSGTLADARQSANVALLNNAQAFTGAKTFSLAPSFTAAGAPFAVSSSTRVTNLNADLLDGLDSSAFLQAIPVPLTLSGNATHIIRGANASTNYGSSGVYGLCTTSFNTTYGVYGQSASTSGRGVFGQATAGTGFTYGVYGQSASTSGIGVSGEAAAASGETYGVLGQSNSTSGTGVWGLAARTSGITYGGRFESFSTDGRGVFGSATALGGITIGVYGQSNSLNGYDFYAGGLGVNYGAASSIRWKSNIEVIDRPLEKLFRLRGVYFDWDAEHGGRHDLGMIAEEVGAVLPEIVNYEENGTDANGMDYSKLTPLLVEALKEQQREIESLRAEKDKEIAELKERLGRLESSVPLLCQQW